eukprot:TRINITY_DN61947_c0_g1_i1.p1 TRINITY_DN61947_c0_g1~~TRINITY_DN61947_c0_g1_i1.p1  ORF type:complete len:694 (+),score=161.47 TRINITY_DN61947_c0_g1_i1:151-2082(+)
MSSVRELLTDMDKIMQQHRLDVGRCLEELQSVHESFLQSSSSQGPSEVRSAASPQEETEERTPPPAQATKMKGVLGAFGGSSAGGRAKGNLIVASGVADNPGTLAQQKDEALDTHVLEVERDRPPDGQELGLVRGGTQKPLNAWSSSAAEGMLNSVMPLTPQSAVPGSHEEAVVNDISVKQAVMLKKAASKAQKTTAEKRLTEKRKSRQFISAEKQAELEMERTTLQKLVHSRLWETSSVVLICVNAAFIGIQTEFLAQRAAHQVRANQPLETSEPVAFFIFQTLFTLAFGTEFFLRWIAEGLKEFWNLQDLSWNLLDCSAVVLGVADLVLETLQSADDTNFSLIRVLRIIRVVRVARIIRVFKFFRELRMMVFSIIGSFKALAWVILILLILFYMFGIVFTQACTSHLGTLSERKDEAHKDLLANFGTLDVAIISLYMSMSGGNDWGMYYEALKPLPIFFRLAFLAFITFAVFAVFNIVTGVFVESAMQSTQADRETVVQDELEAKKSYLSSMQTLFEEMDDDDSGKISLKEFESRLSDSRIQAYFGAMKLDVSDAVMLFKLLDDDDSGEISHEEFVNGCSKLQGEARSLDTKIMSYEVRKTRESMEKVMRTVQDLQAKIDKPSPRPLFSSHGRPTTRGELR